MPSAPIGIAIDGNSGRLYAFSGSAVSTFVPAVYPGLEAPVVSEITTTGAHVSTEVDPGEEPGGGLPADSKLHFEYITKGAYGTNLAEFKDGFVGGAETPDQPLSGPETPEADITGLEPNLDYMVRAKASNSLTFHLGVPTAFHTAPTPPKTDTNDATDVSETSAVLNGTINPVGLPTTYHFEYGTTTAYGSRFPVGIESVAGADRNNRRLGRTITGLAPGTTYHFRLVAQNSAGVNQGADRTFTTAGAGGTPHRAYEQVSPVDKGGIAIVRLFGFQAKADGSAFSYFSQGGSASASPNSRSMSLRGDTDWTGGIDLDPPLAVTPTLIIHTSLAVSADFTHALVATNRKLTPDAIEGGPYGMNLYILDRRTGAYTLVGTAPDGLSSYVGAANSDKFIAGAPDFSWIVFGSFPPLLPGAPANSAYRWSVTDGLEQVSILPNGTPVGSPIFELGDATPVVRSVSEDGSRIYFTVGNQISGSGPDEGIYLWEKGHQTKAISVSHVPGDPTTPRAAALIGISADGRYAFLISRDGKLTADAPDAIPAQQGDVYRYDDADGSLKYLGAAAPHQLAADYSTAFDAPKGVSPDGQTAYFISRPDLEIVVWRNGVVKKTGLPRTATFLSPDGRYLAARVGEGPAADVYLYDSETDQRSCVSCLPDGSSGGGGLAFGERWVSNRLPQVVTDSGRVFFTSTARLVAADVNGAQDVYEYKDGKNSLISPGNAPFDAILADISEDGSDVFFTTGQKLVGQDNDQSIDVYDARVDGGLAKQNPPPPQECIRDDCKATPSAGPEVPFGGSEALSGPGNVTGEARKRCAKGSHTRKVKGKSRCVKQSKAKKKAKNGKSANANRRQGR